MKKLILIISVIIFTLIIILCICFFKYTFKLNYRINYEQVYAIEVHVPGVKGIYTEDTDKIKQIIKNIENIRYYKRTNLKIFNSSPDCYISLFDSDGKIIEEIEYYGDVAVYKNEKFAILPITYYRLEKLCNSINDEK